MSDAGLREAYQSLADRTTESFDQFKQFSSFCEIHPQYVGGVCCGAVLVFGSEIHACILPWAKGLWFSRRAIRLLNAVIAKHGKATTRATTDEGRRFVESLGFVADGEIYRRNRQWDLKH